jgi:hypothetical protein
MVKVRPQVASQKGQIRRAVLVSAMRAILRRAVLFVSVRLQLGH